MMNLKKLILLSLISFCTLNISLLAQSKTDFYSKNWKSVDSLAEQGLVRQALEKTEAIYAKAKTDENHVHQIKALTYKFRYQSQIVEKSDSLNIREMEAAISQANQPAKSILQSILADMYKEYYQRNRYRILNRTALSEQTDDFQTWDAKTLLNKATDLYFASLEEEEILQKESLKAYEPILIKAKESEIYRPSLYDLLAHRALPFFINTEYGISQPIDPFEPEAEKVFVSADQFVDLSFETNDQYSKKLRTIRILQKLLKFHPISGPKAPFVDVELARLRYLRTNAKGDNNDTLFLRSLENLANQVKDDPASAEVNYLIASQYDQRANKYKPLEGETYQWDRKKALSIVQQVIKDYPKAYGASQCRVLESNIKRLNLSLKTESVNQKAKPFRLLVSYRNLSEFHYRIIKTPEKINTQYYREKEVIQQLLKEPVLVSGSYNLNNLGDYQTHSSEVKMPELDPGKYVIIAGSSPNFDVDKDIISYSSTQSSGLAYYQRNYKGNLEIYLTDRESGKPVIGASVQLFKRNNNSGSYEPFGDPYLTSAGGQVTIKNKSDSYNNYQVEVTTKNDKFYSDRLYLYPYYEREELSVNRTHFFTDRRIYRPGQTIYFKAILLKEIGGKHEIRANQEVEVTFFDVNHQEIEGQKLTSNEYGTVTGSFVAPTSGLLGRMTIQANGGYHDFSVEEYKRPKFEVAFEPLKGEFALHDDVEIGGKATSYSGANITGATVNYRVVREVRYPYWFGYFWRMPMPRSQSREITNGTTLTDEFGKFTIPFSLIPDEDVKKSTKPVFSYTVYADVVDITGETHSAQSSVRAGYVALDVSVNVPDMVNPANIQPFTIHTKNLNGSFQPAEGTVKISRLENPDQIFRARRWPEPDQKVLNENEFRQTFPYDVYAQENDFKSWEENPFASIDEKFNTGESKELTASALANAKPGKYKFELTTEDKSGEEIKIIKYFTLENPEAKKAALPVVLDFSLDKSSAEPGETVTATLTTTEKKIWARFEVEHKGKIISSRLVKVKGKKRSKILIPIKDAYRGNISVSVVTISHNEFHQKAQTITVPWTNKQLKLEWSTFRDKLLPGQEEQWKLKITGNKSQAVAAEMVASLYDASLDEFRANSFSLSLYRTNYRQLSWSGYDGFGTSNSRTYQKRTNSISYPPRRSYDQLRFFTGYDRVYKALAGQAMGVNITPRNSAAVDLRERANMSFKPAAAPARDGGVDDSGGGLFMDADSIEMSPEPTPEEEIDPSEDATGSIQIRSNLNETAFFFPQLETNEEGEIIMNFTMPEALTRWKFIGLAHTKDLEIGTIGGATVTQKDLMVTPNQPRFFREGDKFTFSAKVTNLSEENLSGEAKLQLLDAFTRKPVDIEFALRSGTQPFIVPKGQNSLVNWEIEIPSDVPAVVVQVTAKAGDFSDGEEHVIPVLRNSIMVTESIPLAIRGEENKEFTFKKLLASGESETLKHQKLTLEFTSNPAWYAVQSLPYLMEFPHECTEQIFSRFYANSLASHIATESPNVRSVFDQWRNSADNDPGAFLSNLEKNQDLKSVLLEETPWVLNARSESERKRRVGLLFDVNRMSDEMSKTRQQLLERQLSNGGFSWFPGMRDSRYITQLIVQGMGHLQKLNVSTAEGNP